MAITLNSVGHFWAKAWTAIKNALPKIGEDLTKVEGTESTVETVTAAIPGAAAVVPIEKVAFMVLGELSAVLTSGDAAAAQKLTDAGLDVNVVNTVKGLLTTAPQLVALAKTL